MNSDYTFWWIWEAVFLLAVLFAAQIPLRKRKKPVLRIIIFVIIAFFGLYYLSKKVSEKHNLNDK